MFRPLSPVRANCQSASVGPWSDDLFAELSRTAQSCTWSGSPSIWYTVYVSFIPLLIVFGNRVLFLPRRRQCITSSFPASPWFTSPVKDLVDQTTISSLTLICPCRLFFIRHICVLPPLLLKALEVYASLSDCSQFQTCLLLWVWNQAVYEDFCMCAHLCVRAVANTFRHSRSAQTTKHYIPPVSWHIYLQHIPLSGVSCWQRHWDRWGMHAFIRIWREKMKIYHCVVWTPQEADEWFTTDTLWASCLNSAIL